MEISDQYKRHRWKFIVFGAISGALMSYFSPMQASTSSAAEFVGDVVGGILLWYILWWLWAKTKARATRNEQ
jgi:hypothetical protein